LGRVDDAELVLDRIEGEARLHHVDLPAPETTLEPDVRPSRWHEPFASPYRARTVLLWTMAFTDFFATYGYAIWLPTLYVTLGGLQPSASLALTAVGGVLQLVSAYSFAGTVDRVGRRNWFLGGFALASVAAAGGAGAIVAGATTWPTLFLVASGLLFGLTPVSMGLYLYAGELYPTRMRAWGTGLAAAWIRVAGFVAPIVVGAVLTAGAGIAVVFVLFSVVTAVGWAVMFALGPETRHRVLEELAT
jgi:putative MFS transporter